MRVFELYMILKADTQEIHITNVNGVDIYKGLNKDLPQFLFNLAIRECYSTERNLTIIVDES